MTRGGFAFGAQISKVIGIYSKVCLCGRQYEAFHANGFVGGELSVCRTFATENADVAEGAAKVLGVAGVECNLLFAPFPPEGRTVGDVAVIACESFV